MSDIIENRWNEQVCENFSEPELLRYRSNLLGADLRITNFGGGNTSAKIRMPDPLTGENVDVLWVKGSGGDLGSMQLDGFATLYLDKLFSLQGLYRGIEFEDEMVAYLPHCTFDLNPRAASIDTPLHAFIPHKHIDHLHPDAVIAIAASRNGEALTRDIFGDEIGWLPWQRPGFDLGLKLQEFCETHPQANGVILGGHGLFTWAETSKHCYKLSLRIIQTAADFLHEKSKTEPFGKQMHESLTEDKQNQFLTSFVPTLRGKLSRDNMKIAHFNNSAEVLEFLNSERAAELAALGTSCPDHFLRTKIKPLFIEIDLTAELIATAVPDLDQRLAQYKQEYRAYYDRCKTADSPPMRDAYPVVILIPGIGMLTFAKDKATARIAGEFYVNAINVMRGAEGVSAYVGLSEQEAFNIEYWALEEAKLQRMPPEKSLSRRIALVTGGAGGIGKATAQRLLQDGACVMLADIDAEALQTAEQELTTTFGADYVRTVIMDVTDETSVVQAFGACIGQFGGIDILVSNAGIASSAPVEETTLELWNRNMDILSTGYFLVSREAFKIMTRQHLGGSIIFIGSKNALAASPNAAAYCTAKASVLHLARCLALEGAGHGIRVNTVNPDAVLSGSRIWRGDWRKERAAAYNIADTELEEFYRKRSMLQRNVFPEDIAEAVAFFASEKTAKSTANLLNVDAGNAAAFSR